MESLFNTSKSNKHLWEQISRKMKEHGYDRSATMCTDKWRNLLKEYKKAKAHDKGTSKVAFYKDLEEILGERAKSIPYRSPAKPGMLHLSTKGKYRQNEDERNSYMYHTFEAHFTQSSSSRRSQDHNAETDGGANQDRCGCFGFVRTDTQPLPSTCCLQSHRHSVCMLYLALTV
jgi:hypothetical protein